MKTHSCRVRAAWIIAAILSVSHARADLIAYDGFSADDYTIPVTVGDNTVGLKNVNGGVGWATGWTIYAVQFLRPGRVHAAQPGLSYPRLASLDYRAYWDNGSDNRLGRSHSATRTIANAPIGGVDGTTVWLAVLHRRDTVSTSGSSVGGIGLMSGATDVVRLTLSSLNASQKWQLAVSGGSAVSYPVNAPAAGTTGIVLVRIDYKAGDDDVYLWAGATLDLSAEPPTATALKVTAAASGFDTFQLVGPNYNNTSYDEIRLATTFLDVIGYKAPPTLITLR